MKRITIIWLCFITLALVQGCMSNKRASNYNTDPLVDDQGLIFLHSGTESSLALIKMSGLPIANSKNQRVVQFAKRMIDDNTNLVNDLKKLQTDNFVTSEDSISDVHQQVITGLEKKPTATFDKAYLQEVMNEQQRAIGLFDAAVHNKNANVADFAKQQLPVLKARLDSAKAVDAVLK
jgi:putative membrane protein